MELIVGIGIVGLVLAASLPGFRSMLEGYRHGNSVSQVTSRLFMVRQMAVRDKVPFVVTLDAVNDRMGVFEDADGDGVFDAGEETHRPYVMDQDVGLQNVSWAGNQLTFFPNGSASQTADMRVVDAHGRSRTIRVNSITGNTEVLP
jgi:Tfp pilus assembly protein FimT